MDSFFALAVVVVGLALVFNHFVSVRRAGEEFARVYEAKGAPQGRLTWMKFPGIPKTGPTIYHMRRFEDPELEAAAERMRRTARNGLLLVVAYAVAILLVVLFSPVRS